MEGRWAKLTLYAHLHKYIDIKKDINPLIEDTIFNYIESTETLKTVVGYPRLDTDESILLLNNDWIKPYSRCILSWVKSSGDAQTDTDDLSKIAQWELLNKGLENNGR